MINKEKSKLDIAAAAIKKWQKLIVTTLTAIGIIVVTGILVWDKIDEQIPMSDKEYKEYMHQNGDADSLELYEDSLKYYNDSLIKLGIDPNAQ